MCIYLRLIEKNDMDIICSTPAVPHVSNSECAVMATILYESVPSGLSPCQEKGTSEVFTVQLVHRIDDN